MRSVAIDILYINKFYILYISHRVDLINRQAQSAITGIERLHEMTDLTAYATPSWTSRIRNWFATPATKALAGEPDLDTAMADLIDAIQNGYTDEETGGHVEIPGFARTQLITLMRGGDA
jgi:hypothetical protein